MLYEIVNSKIHRQFNKIARVLFCVGSQRQMKNASKKTLSSYVYSMNEQHVREKMLEGKFFVRDFFFRKTSIENT